MEKEKLDRTVIIIRELIDALYLETRFAGRGSLFDRARDLLDDLEKEPKSKGEWIVFTK